MFHVEKKLNHNIDNFAGFWWWRRFRHGHERTCPIRRQAAARGRWQQRLWRRHQVKLHYPMFVSKGWPISNLVYISIAYLGLYKYQHSSSRKSPSKLKGHLKQDGFRHVSWQRQSCPFDLLKFAQCAKSWESMWKVLESVLIAEKYA